jgi:formylglycine-generating enzyme required for sulfatase activity
LKHSMQVICFALLVVLILTGCAPSAAETTGSTSQPPALTDTPAEALADTSTATAPPPTDTPMPTATPEPTDTPEPTSTFTPTPLPAEIQDPSGAEMILIPAGPFTMGSDTNQAAARPAHTVTLDDFYIDKYEVTNEQYLVCVEEGSCPTGGGSRLRNPNWIGHPVMDVTWYDAQRFCEWRGGRLPTEAEWEKAARGTDERTFPWGEDAVTCELVRYGACGWMTAPVGSHPKGVSPYGVHDMAGNAWEWTADWYLQKYYEQSPAENPTGPDFNTYYKSTRGGAWFYQAGLQTAIWRNHAPPEVAYSYLGFRCVRDVP